MSAPLVTYSNGATCRVSLPAELEAVRDTVRMAHRFLAEQNLDAPELIACELALTEACNNAVAYSHRDGSSSDPLGVPPLGCQHQVQIEIFCDARQVEMHEIDHGPGFEW